MLIGEFQHTLDAKGRVNFPAKLREELGERFFITKGLDGCLFVYPQKEWDGLAEKIQALPLSQSKNIQRFFFGGASEAEPDKQGRVMIPANLRSFAGLEKDVVIVGTNGRAEIWDKGKWDAFSESITDESIGDYIDTIGF